MTIPMTHYLPPFTRPSLLAQTAVCGAPTLRREHSTEPTCPKCAAWLAADAAEGERLARQWDAEDQARRERAARAYAERRTR